MPTQNSKYYSIMNYIKKLIDDPLFKNTSIINIKDHAMNKDGNCVGFSTYWLIQMHYAFQQWENTHADMVMTFKIFQEIANGVVAKENLLFQGMDKYIAGEKLTIKEHENIQCFIRVINTIQSHPRSYKTGNPTATVNLNKIIMDSKNQSMKKIFSTVSSDHKIKDLLLKINNELRNIHHASIDLLIQVGSQQHQTGIFKHDLFCASYDPNDGNVQCYDLNFYSLEQQQEALTALSSEIKKTHTFEKSRFPIALNGYELKATPLNESKIGKNSLFKIPPDHSDIESLCFAARHGTLDVSELKRKNVDLGKKDYKGRTLLMHATSGDQITLVKELLKNGSPDLMNEHGTTASDIALVGNFSTLIDLFAKQYDLVNESFIEASKENNIEKMRNLLKQGANPNLIIENRSILKTAILIGEIEIVRLLLESGAKVDLEEKEMNAIENIKIAELIQNSVELVKQVCLNNIEAVKAILSKNPVVDFLIDDKTPLMRAAEMGEFKMVQLLIENRASIELQNSRGKTAFNVASICGRTHPILQLFLNTPCQIYQDALDQALISTAQYDNKELALNLLKRGANPNSELDESTSPLIEAVRCKSINVAKLLIEHKADIHKVTFHRGAPMSPLSEALTNAKEKERDEMVQFLLNNKADPKLTNLILIAQFKLALGNCETETMLKLIALGVDPNITDNKKNTLLMKCIIDTYSNPQVIAKILENKSFQINAQNIVGYTALMMTNEVDICKLLIKASADLNLQNKKGKTALMIAIEDNRIDQALVLLEASADCSIKDINGNTTMKFAENNGNLTLISKLKEKEAVTPPLLETETQTIRMVC